MSVRAVAIRSGPRPSLRAVPAAPARVRRRAVRRGTVWAAFADDRRLIGVKLILIGMVGLVMMATEAPW